MLSCLLLLDFNSHGHKICMRAYFVGLSVITFRPSIGKCNIWWVNVRVESRQQQQLDAWLKGRKEVEEKERKKGAEVHYNRSCSIVVPIWEQETWAELGGSRFFPSSSSSSFGSHNSALARAQLSKPAKFAQIDDNGDDGEDATWMQKKERICRGSLREGIRRPLAKYTHSCTALCITRAW